MDWIIRNKFMFWKIENSKGKLVADNSPNKEASVKDENGTRLSTELDALERLGIAERYSVYAMQKNGQDWQMHPFMTYAPAANNTASGGSFPVEMAMMLGRMQAEQASQQVIWQLQREKEERERKEQEAGSGIGDLAKMLKPLAPALISSVAPMAIKGIFDLADKSPQIRAFLEKVTANPAVQEGIMQMLTNYFTNQAQAQANGNTGTDIEKFDD